MSADGISENPWKREGVFSNFSLPERKVTKEAGERAARPLASAPIAVSKSPTVSHAEAFGANVVR